MTNRYYVTVREVHTQGYWIDAPDEETAKQTAAMEGQIDEGSFAYSHTLDHEHTTVELTCKDHKYVDIRNSVIQSGMACMSCGALKAGNDGA